MNKSFDTKTTTVKPTFKLSDIARSQGLTMPEYEDGIFSGASCIAVKCRHLAGKSSDQDLKKCLHEQLPVIRIDIVEGIIAGEQCVFALLAINKTDSLSSYSKMATSVTEAVTLFHEAIITEEVLFDSQPNVTHVNGFIYIDEILSNSKLSDNERLKYKAKPSCIILLYAIDTIISNGQTATSMLEYDYFVNHFNHDLDSKQLKHLWNSAVRLCKTRDRMVNPGKYKLEKIIKYLQPQTCKNDVEEATLFSELFKDKIMYSDETSFMVYDGTKWIESESMARSLVHDFTALQLADVLHKLEKSRHKCKVLHINVDNANLKTLDYEQSVAYSQYRETKNAYKCISGYCNSVKISSVIKESEALLNFNYKKLDSDPYMLCTPEFTVDLRSGVSRPHNYKDYNTKVTALSPSNKGKDIWLECLDRIFCGNQELINYIQQICGLAAIGKVFNEALIISYGSGRNGKSTFWNTISRVLGDYSGHVSPDILTSNTRRNVRPEIAEIRGKRFIIAAELSEWNSLDESAVKQLCSTDKITAEKKYKAPFEFTPTHTLVLFTNILPKVMASDDGTWRRIIVIPFDAKIKGNSEIKNYSDYLFNNAGEYILKWIIDGAKIITDKDYIFERPECVKKAISEYRSENNWVNRFIDEHCIKSENDKVPAVDIYKRYHSYCLECGEKARSNSDFYNALTTAGYEKTKENSRTYFKGLNFKANDKINILD